MIEYLPQSTAVAVDARAGVIKFEVQDDVKADVLNVLPPMRAGTIAQSAGLANQANRHWCGVDFRTFESTAARDVFVIGDAIQSASAMPKSGHMANNHAKVAAAAIVAQLSGWPVNPAPMLTNTCYSYVDDTKVIHDGSVHENVPEENTYRTVTGAGGLSAAANQEETPYAESWAQNIWADMLA